MANSAMKGPSRSDGMRSRWSAHALLSKTVSTMCRIGYCSVLITDRVQLTLRPQQQPVTDDRGGSLGHLIQQVHVQRFVLLTRRDHECLALLTQAEHLAVVSPRR